MTRVITYLLSILVMGFASIQLTAQQVNLFNQNQLQSTIKTIIPQTNVGKSTSNKSLGINQSWCHSDEITNNFIQQQILIDPSYTQKIAAQEQLIQQWKQSNIFAKKVLRTIPVVVHVVHNPSNSNNPSENVSDAAIYDMINTLNEDFRRLNADTSNTRSFFKPVAADVEIEFCLASKDPNGASTIGITRTVTSEVYYDNNTETNKMKTSSSGGADPWPGNKYLNIWICNISNYQGYGVAGYAYLPTPGMHGSSIDGLVLDFDIGIGFGDRTATHEIGHYLNLKHVWGNNPPSCGNDDGFADTPNSGSENYGCNYSSNTCGTANGDQIENYMSYANCQNMFSSDQAAEMNAILSGVRSSLLTSDGCEPTAPPVADFVASDTVIQAGGYVFFTDLSTGVPDTWSWSFGGGGSPNTSTFKNPVIQFNTIGTYNVSLTVINTLGSNAITKTLYIDVIAPLGCDTINWTFLADTPLFIYSCTPTPTCGYILGTNQYDDLSKAQLFTITEYAPSTHVTGGLFYFARAYKDPGSNAQVVFKVWDSDGTAGAPGTVLGTDTVDLADIVSDVQNNYLTQTLFNPPVYVTNDYYFGFEMLNFDLWGGGTRDSLTLVQTENGVSAGSIPWEQWDDNTWHDLASVWGFSATTIFATPYMTTLPPTPMFTADTVVGCEGLTVTFDAGASINANGYYWDVDGDGFYDWYTIDSLITITYDTTGTFDVKLLVEGPCTGINDTVFTNFITINDNPLLSTVIGDANCGACDGMATVSPTGGTGPFTYQWDDPSNQTNAGATSLCPGSYQVIVTDANGCTNTDGGSVSDGAGMIIDSSISTIDSCGKGVGTVSIYVSGGTGPYSYLWDDSGIQTNQSAIGLSSGTYNVTVSDASNCSVETDFFTAGVVSSSQDVNDASIMGVNVTCSGGNDGSATVSVTTGSAPYNYLWNDTGSQTNAMATGLLVGSYTVTITDLYLCTDTESVVITQISTLSANIGASTNITCNGGNDGSATLTTSGGTGPYTYSWNTSPVQSNATAINLTANSYIGSVTDSVGCTAVDVITITEPTAVTGTTGSINATCGNADGSAYITASGGNSPYFYLWDDLGMQTTDTASGLIANNYNVTVTDNSGCTYFVAVSVNDAGAPIATISNVVNVTCNGGSDGSAMVTASNGIPPYSYQWSTGGSTTAETNMPTGTHSATVTDAVGCITVVNVSITEPSAINIASEVSVDVSCNGLADGTITVSATGGTGTLSYSIDSGTTYANTSGNFTALNPSTYGISVQDSNGCTITGSILVINEPGAISIISEIAADLTCYGNGDGTITINASGGVGILSYSIDGGSTYPSTSGSFTGLSAGTYNISVQDSNGCNISGSSLTITEPAAFTANTNAVPSNCGQGDGQASVEVFGGIGPFTYLWDDTGNSTTDTITGLGAGVYNVTVTDSNGCTSISAATITDASAGTSTASVIQNATCFGGCDGSATVTVTGGTAPLTYLWDDPAAQTVQTAIGLCADEYIVDITDANGCVLTDSVNIVEPPELMSALTTTAATSGSCNGTATVTAAGGTGSYTYLWDDPLAQTTATATGLCPGSITVTVTDANGCESIKIDSIGTVIGLSEITSPAKLNIFPNPNQGSFKVEYKLNTSENAIISIYNNIGEIVLSYNLGVSLNGVYTVNMNSQANGIYYIQLATDSKIWNKKISLIK